MTPLYKILSISVISVICASEMYVQGRSLAFSSDVGTAYAKRGDIDAEDNNRSIYWENETKPMNAEYDAISEYREEM